jgi:hypothetical protein
MENQREILALLADEKLRLNHELKKVNLAIDAYLPIVFNKDSKTSEKIIFALGILKCASLVEIAGFLYQYELNYSVEIEHLTFKIKNTLVNLKKKKAVQVVLSIQFQEL